MIYQSVIIGGSSVAAAPVAGPWSLVGASYDGVSFSVGAQETIPTDLSFKSDGTKMYITGFGGTDSIYQYTLSTPWNVGTASYDSVSFNTGAQDDSIREVLFKSDGTKMFIAGSDSDSIHQYSLSTPWNIGTASYDSISFSVAGQGNSPFSAQFKSDGSKMFMLDDTTGIVYQYTLSTPWNIGTASYDSVSFSVASQESSPHSFEFKSDGTKMFIVGSFSDTVYQYSLSTPWNIGTASYDSVSFSVVSQENNPNGLAFKSDGTKMFIVGNSTDNVYQYSL